MELIVALEIRFARTPDGAIWTRTGLPRPYWDRYLKTFRRVHLLARCEEVPRREPGWTRVDGDGVDVLAVPCFVGPTEFLLRRRAVRAAIFEAVAAHADAAAILRVPGTMGTIAADALRAARRPFALEVVGDPYDVFAPGASNHPLRPFFRWWSTRTLRRLCQEGSCALYVTRAALQRRYPPRSAVKSFGVSDVETADEAFAPAPRPLDAPVGPPFRIVHVGTLDALYKGPDVLIDAVGHCAAAHLDVVLTIVGDGRLRPLLEARARRRGIAERVRFVGHLPSGEAVRRELDRGHLFLLPSRQEGLPRALVEAMARGLPCLATGVGGIPELLAPEDIVQPDARAVAARVQEVAKDAMLRAAMSRRNLERAQLFRQDMLQPQRAEFFREVIARAERRAPKTAVTT